MIKEIFYQASLPRSGSTLLQNVIGENPDFYVTPTDGLLELVVGAQHNYTSSPEFKAQDAMAMKKAFLAYARQGMTAYCEALSERPYHLNKSRGWGIYRPLLQEIFPEKSPKVICMIRDLRDVFASMEKNHRKNPDKASQMINWAEMQGTTLPKRIDMWAGGVPIGMAIERLQEIVRQGYSDKMLFVKYEDFCLRPDAEMQRIYTYLEVPSFQHDFDNIQQRTKEDDEIYGITGLHDIRPRLSLKPSDAKAVLGRDVADWIYNNYKWFYDLFGYKK